MAGPEAAREAVARLGARLTKARHFEDNLLLDDPAGPLRAAGSILRLRRVPEGGVVTHKGPRLVEAGLKSRREGETRAGRPDVLPGPPARLRLGPGFAHPQH